MLPFKDIGKFSWLTWLIQPKILWFLAPNSQFCLCKPAKFDSV